MHLHRRCQALPHPSQRPNPNKQKSESVPGSVVERRKPAEQLPGNDELRQTRALSSKPAKRVVPALKKHVAAVLRLITCAAVVKTGVRPYTAAFTTNKNKKNLARQSQMPAAYPCVAIIRKVKRRILVCCPWLPPQTVVVKHLQHRGVWGL